MVYTRNWNNLSEPPEQSVGVNGLHAQAKEPIRTTRTIRRCQSLTCDIGRVGQEKKNEWFGSKVVPSRPTTPCTRRRWRGLKTVALMERVACRRSPRSIEPASGAREGRRWAAPQPERFLPNFR